MEDIKSFVGKWAKDLKPEDFRLSEELFNLITERKYTIRYLDDQRYHVVNYWDKQGFLLVKRETTSTWRRFSFAEYVWMQMLQELTDMGIALEKVVKAIKKEFGIPDPPSYLEEEAMSVEEKIYYSTPNDETAHEAFGGLLVHSMLEKNPVALRIYRDEICQAIWGKSIFLFLTDQTREWDFFIHVSLSELLSKILAAGKFDNIMVKHALDENEAEVLKHLRNNELTSVSIQLKDGVPVMLELTAEGQVNDAFRLAEYLVEGKYQKITYSTNGGKKASFKKTTKVKL